MPATALGPQFGPLSPPSSPTLSVNPAARRPSSKHPPPPSSPSSAVGTSESSMSPLAPLRAACPSRCAQTWCTIAAPYASDKTFTVVRTCTAQGGAAAGRHPLPTLHALRRRGRGARTRSSSQSTAKITPRSPANAPSPAACSTITCPNRRRHAQAPHRSLGRTRAGRAGRFEPGPGHAGWQPLRGGRVRGCCAQDGSGAGARRKAGADAHHGHESCGGDRGGPDGRQRGRERDDAHLERARRAPSAHRACVPAPVARSRRLYLPARAGTGQRRGGGTPAQGRAARRAAAR
jgi:hypothetical protein